MDAGTEAAALAQVQAWHAAALQLQAQTADMFALSALVWKLSAACIVFLMQLGFSLIEAGTVRYKNTRNIMIKNVLDTCVSCIAFWLFGYAFAFGYGSPFIGWATPNGQPAFAQVADPVQWFFQFVFVATSATIFAGAVAERTQIAAYFVFNFFLAAIIYPVVAHMLWSANGVFSVEGGRSVLGAVGVLDNAGSMVVHVTGGVTSLVAAWMVGPRIGRFDIDGKPIAFRGHSLVFIAAGTLAIWVGFLGFNGGSIALFPGESGDQFLTRVRSSVVNTIISAAFAGATAFAATYWWRRPCPEHTFNGVIGGLVAACATSSLVEAYGACVIGVIASLVYLAGQWIVTNKLGIDDPVHAVGVHLFCGTWGSLAAGLLATPNNISQTYNLSSGVTVSSCGLFYGCGFSQLGIQVLSLLFVYAWVGATSLLLFFLLDFFGLLRVTRQEEEVGLDIAFHGAGGQGDEALDGMAQAEEGEVEMRHVAALKMRLMTWRKLRGLATAQSHDAPAPVMSAGKPRQGASPNSSSGSGESTSQAGVGQAPPQHGGLGDVMRGFSLLALNGYAKGAKGAARRVASGNQRDVWHRELERTNLGHFSLAMYEANYVMEDAVEVHVSPDMVFLAVHDGHNGSEAAEFVRDSLWGNIKARAKAAGLSAANATAEVIQAGFEDTEAQFTEVVRQAFDETAPHLATVGACTAAVVVARNALWAANVGDCRAVLGQLRKETSGELEFRAVQLTKEHNLSDKDLRDAYILQHMDMPDAVLYKRGAYRVKGRVTVTRSFGDLYLKSHEFNREPLVSRFRIPEPFNPPMLTAQPSIAMRVVSPHDAFVIVASDGLFEYLSNEEAVSIVAQEPRKNIARTLIRAALEKAAAQKEIELETLLKTQVGERRFFHDDMTVVVFFFDHEAMQQRSRDTGFWSRNISFRGGNSSKAAAMANADLDFSTVSSTKGGSIPGFDSAQTHNKTNSVSYTKHE